MSLLARRVSDDPRPSEIALAGMPCWLDPSGGLFMLDEQVLIVADLHLEKGSSAARRGFMLPPYDTRATIDALDEVIARLSPRRVIALGDSFHDRFGPDRLCEEDRARLLALTRGRDWTWVTGNHDPALPSSLGGEVVHHTTLGPLTLRHHPTAEAMHEVAGHLHPVAKVVMHGRGVRVRAFLTDGRRCVMPAFGAYAGGLNACAPVFEPLFRAGFTAHALGQNRVFAISRAVLCRD